MSNINPTVSNFFDKNPESNYLQEYENSHGPRLDALVDHFKLRDFSGKAVDVGGGLGFLGKRLPKAEYVVVDGADITDDQKLCKGDWIKADLDHDHFGYDVSSWLYRHFDMAFFLESCEHLGNPHHALVEIKKLVKRNGYILISIPTETVTHNSPYPSLLWPIANFQLFLSQMALPVIEFWEYQPKTVGWPAYHFLCRNADWREKVLLFPKTEEKFVNCTPLEATNL